jgi:hypothetical protein
VPLLILLYQKRHPLAILTAQVQQMQDMAVQCDVSGTLENASQCGGVHKALTKEGWFIALP